MSRKLLLPLPVLLFMLSAQPATHFDGKTWWARFSPPTTWRAAKPAAQDYARPRSMSSLNSRRPACSQRARTAFISR